MIVHAVAVAVTAEVEVAAEVAAVVAVLVGTGAVLVGGTDVPVAVATEVFVRVAVAVGATEVLVAVGAGGVLVAVATGVLVATGVPVVQGGCWNVSINPALKPPVLHSNWVNREPVSFCTPTVALDPV